MTCVSSIPKCFCSVKHPVINILGITRQYFVELCSICTNDKLKINILNISGVITKHYQWQNIYFLGYIITIPVYKIFALTYNRDLPSRENFF